MPSFRGTPQSELMNVIEETLAFIEARALGPQTQATIDALRAGDANGTSKLSAIAKARSDEALVKAVTDADLTTFFTWGTEFLEYHAKCDTDGKGYTVLRDLVQSGLMNDYTFDPREHLGYPKEFADFMKGHKIRKVFNAVHPGIRHKLDDLDKESPMAQYGILNDERAEERGPVLKELRSRVQEILEPYAQLREARHIGFDLIERTDEIEAASADWGVMFYATRRAAQAVADALPNKTVVCLDGQRISPQPRPPAKKLSPKR